MLIEGPLLSSDFGKETASLESWSEDNECCETGVTVSLVSETASELPTASGMMRRGTSPPKPETWTNISALLSREYSRKRQLDGVRPYTRVGKVDGWLRRSEARACDPM